MTGDTAAKPRVPNWLHDAVFYQIYPQSFYDSNGDGIGEMGVPPVPPMIANAIYAATGKRIRHIPILPEDLR